MEPLIVVAVPFVLCWLLFILPRQRQVRAHEALVVGLAVGDEVVLSAGIYGRIVELGADELRLEVAPGVALRVARRAVLRRADGGDRAVEAVGAVEAEAIDGETVDTVPSVAPGEPATNDAPSPGGPAAPGATE
jgi:preprotein translocase subunit YajC